MEKKLRMNKPLIDSFCIYGDIFSILPSNEYVTNWICNNFIQIRRINPVIFFESYRSVFFNCPHITRTVISRKQLNARWSGNLYQLIKEMIDDGYYVFFYVDRAYINKYETKDEHEHEFWVYGYDDEKNRLFCADNLQSGKYTLFEVDINEVSSAYWSLLDLNYITDIIGISNDVEQNWFEDIKIHQIRSLFNDYVESLVTPNMGERYNVSECGFILQEQELKKINDYYITDKMIDLRPLCVFKEHKKIMIIRLKRLNDLYPCIDFKKFIDVYSECERAWGIIVKLSLKYNMYHCSEDVYRILEYGYNALENERKVMRELLMILDDIILDEKALVSSD